MARELTVRIAGKDNRLAAKTLADALRRILDLLSDLDANVSTDGRACIQWEVVRVSMHSPLALTLSPRVLRERADTAGDVVRLCIGGLRALEERATPPERFGDSALQHARELLSLFQDGVERLSFASPGEGEVQPSLRAVANLDALWSEEGTARHAITTIEGPLELISVHGRTQVGIWDALTNSKVSCIIPDELLHDAKEALGKRVSATGRASLSPQGRPRSMTVETLRVLRTQRGLPQPWDFEGEGAVDITGGVESAEYVRGLRDGD